MTTPDKIQAALLCVQIAVGGIQAITTWFFIRSVGITQQQEKDAKQQILLAQEQMALMDSQYRDSLRPLMVVTFSVEGSNLYEIKLSNDGNGAALNIECDPAIDLRGTVVGSKSSVTASVPKRDGKGKNMEQLYILTYKSLDGHSYATCFFQHGVQFSVENYQLLTDNHNIETLHLWRDGFNVARSTQNKN